MTFVTDTADGVILAVRVIPRARHTEVAGTRDDALLIRLAAPPVDGAANEALVKFIARQLNVPGSGIHIVSGERGREKRIAIAGVTAQQVRGAFGL